MGNSAGEISDQEEKKVLPLEVIQLCHRLGIHGESIYIPSNWAGNRKLRLTRWILMNLECRYEDLGDVPSNWAQVKSLYKMKNIMGFPEQANVTPKELANARLEAWRKYKIWFYGTAEYEGELHRLDQIRKYFATSSLTDVLWIYQDIRRQLRNGSFDIGEIQLDQLDSKYLHSMAKKSLETSWRR